MLNTVFRPSQESQHCYPFYQPLATLQLYDSSLQNNRPPSKESHLWLWVWLYIDQESCCYTIIWPCGCLQPKKSNSRRVATFCNESQATHNLINELQLSQKCWANLWRLRRHPSQDNPKRDSSQIESGQTIRQSIKSYIVFTFAYFWCFW